MRSRCCWSLALSVACIGLSRSPTYAQPFSPIPHTLDAHCCDWNGWADYDADGDADVLLADLVGANTEPTRLYRNQGDGVFQAVELPPTQSSYYGFRAFWNDDNGDGLPDMLTTASDEASQPVMRLFHQFSADEFVDSGLRLAGEPFLWADLDNDGDLDILASSSMQLGTCWLYWNQGGTGFVQTSPGFDPYLVSAAAVDLDGDGDLDLVLLAGTIHPTVRVYRNDGYGRFTETGVPLPARGATTAAWTDLDGDGDLDLVGSGVKAYGILAPKVYLNDGGWRFMDTHPSLPSSSAGTLRWADFNQDGHPDVLINARPQVTSGLYDPRPRLFFNDGNQQFTESELQLPMFQGGGAEVMDVDGDGDVDFMISGEEFSSAEPASRRLYRNDRAASGAAPPAPADLSAVVVGHRVTLRWDGPPAESASGVSFGLRVGTQPGAGDIVNPWARENGGRLVPGLGNAQASRRWYLLGLRPGQYYWSVQAIDASFRGSAFAPESSFVVPELPPLPPPPTVSSMPHQFAEEDEPLSPIPFTIGPENSAANLEVTVEASNPTLAPASGMTLSGKGADRWLLISPGKDQNGTSLITVRVTDAFGQSAETSFLLTVHAVNDPPTLGPIPNQVMYENQTDLSVPLQVADVDALPGELYISAFSSNASLISGSGLRVQGSSWIGTDTVRLIITPQHGQSGSAIVTVRVSDGLLQTSTAFVVTVFPRPFLPAADRITNYNQGSVGWADLDGDGDLDLLATDSPAASWSSTVRLYDNVGAARLMDTGLALAGPYRRVESLVDYDRDGDVDAVLASYDAAEVLSNDGEGNFTTLTNLGQLIPSLISSSSHAWGDLDNDGSPDLVFSRLPHQLGVLLQRDGFASVAADLPAISGYVALGDYDGDAILDLAFSGVPVSGSTNDAVNAILRGLGGGTFGASGIVLDQSSYGPIGFCDLDGDGALDFWQVGFATASRYMLFYRNVGAGEFGAPVELPVPLRNPDTLRWADFDGDGDLDFIIEVSLVTGGTGGILTMYRNEGDLQFTPMGNLLPYVEARFLGIGDIDNDGDVDLSAVLWESTRSARILTNRFSALNPPPGPPSGLEAHIDGASVWLSWHPATDLNQSGGLSYNVRVGTQPGIGDVVPSMTSTNGSRLVVGFGNAGVRTNYFLTNLVGETFYWSVQAVDNSYIGGPFASERSFTIDLPGNQPPVIGEIPDQITDEDTPLAVSFTMQDDRTPLEKLRLRLYPEDPFLLPVANAAFIGNGTNRTLTLLPATNAFGATRLTVEVMDAVGSSATRSFLLTVRPVNDEPAISAIPHQTNLWSAESIAVQFSILDPDTPADELELEAESSHPELVPASSIEFSGSGNDRSAIIRPGVSQAGQTLLTVTVRDPEGATASTSFLLVLQDQVFRQIQVPFAGVRFGSIAWGDYDNDGDLDLALAGDGIDQTAIYQNQGGGVFTKADTYLPAVEGGRLMWGDYDNDGDLDLLIPGRIHSGGGLRLLIYQNVGEGIFELANAEIPGLYGPSSGCDIDNDGDLDLVSSGHFLDSNYRTLIYRNEGGSRFALTGDSISAVGNGNIGLSGVSDFCEDLDQDGYQDLILQSLDGVLREEWFRNNGQGLFSRFPSPWSGTIQAWADFDADGLPDALESLEVPTGLEDLRIQRNRGEAQLEPWGVAIQTNFISDCVAIGDFDNDGRLDVFSSGFTQTLQTSYLTRLFRNQGNGTWTDVDIPVPDFQFAAASWADVDNDGDLDLLVCGQRDAPPLQGYSTLLYLNDQIRSNTPPTAPGALAASLTADSAILHWAAAMDADQSGGLTYNVRIGTTPGGQDVLSPMSTEGGWRRVPAPGNAGWLTRKVLTGLRPGQTYYWSVQAVDNVFAGSAFATESSFMISPVWGVDLHPDGSISLNLTGALDRVYVIETSTDLQTWLTVGSFTAAAGRIELVGAPVGPGTARFYRARLP